MSEQIKQLQILEQNVQMIRTQLHSLKSGLLECETAKKSLADKEEAYSFVGNIMIKDNPQSLIADLDERISRLTKQKESFETQEKQLLEQKANLEKQLLGEQHE